MELNPQERKLLDLLVAEREKGYGADAGWLGMEAAYRRCEEHLTMYGVSDFDRAYELIREAGLTEKSSEGSRVRATMAGVSLVRALRQREVEATSEKRKSKPFRVWGVKILEYLIAAVVGAAVLKVCGG